MQKLSLVQRFKHCALPCPRAWQGTCQSIVGHLLPWQENYVALLQTLVGGSAQQGKLPRTKTTSWGKPTQALLALFVEVFQSSQKQVMTLTSGSCVRECTTWGHLQQSGNHWPCEMRKRSLEKGFGFVKKLSNSSKTAKPAPYYGVWKVIFESRAFELWSSGQGACFMEVVLLCKHSFKDVHSVWTVFHASYLYLFFQFPSRSTVLCSIFPLWCICKDINSGFCFLHPFEKTLKILE